MDGPSASSRQQRTEEALQQLVALRGQGVLADLARLRNMLVDVLGREAYACGEQVRALLAAAEAMVDSGTAMTDPAPPMDSPASGGGSPSIPADIVEELVATGIERTEAQWAVDALGRTLPTDDGMTGDGMGSGFDVGSGAGPGRAFGTPVPGPSGPAMGGSVGQVLPVSLHRWGGIRGLDERLIVTADGSVDVRRGPQGGPVRRQLSPDRLAVLEDGLRRALSSATSLPPPATVVADDVHYRLEAAGRSIALTASGGIPAALRPTIDALTGLLDEAPPAPDAPPAPGAPPVPGAPGVPPTPPTTPGRDGGQPDGVQPGAGRVWIWAAAGVGMVTLLVVGLLIGWPFGDREDVVEEPTPTPTAADETETDNGGGRDTTDQTLLIQSSDGIVEVTAWDDWDYLLAEGQGEHYLLASPDTDGWSGNLPDFDVDLLVIVPPSGPLTLGSSGFALRVLPPTIEVGRRLVDVADVTETTIRNILDEFRLPQGCGDWSRVDMPVGTLDGWADRLAGVRDVHACDDGSDYVLGGAWNPDVPRFIVLWEWHATPDVDRTEFDVLGTLVVSGGAVLRAPLPYIECNSNASASGTGHGALDQGTVVLASADPLAQGAEECPRGRRVHLDILTEQFPVIRERFCFDTTEQYAMPSGGLARVGCTLHDTTRVDYIIWDNSSDLEAYAALFAAIDGVDERNWTRPGSDETVGTTYEWVHEGSASFLWTYPDELFTGGATLPGSDDQDALNQRWRRALAVER